MEFRLVIVALFTDGEEELTSKRLDVGASCVQKLWSAANKPIIVAQNIRFFMTISIHH
jgi:hypothetical protein